MITVHEAELGAAYTAAYDDLLVQSEVPEPATVWLLGAGVVMVGWRRGQRSL